MTTNYAGRIPPGRASGRAGAQPPESLEHLLPELTVDEKALLLTGADSWRTQGAEALGLRPMITSDGPAGVRGVVLDERQPSSSLPCPSALGATWDPELVRELAAALGAEARGKGVDVLLAPTINLMRTPLGGRGFECFSEDPVLTARLGVAFVAGVQSAGVAATVKHFVCNDTETERWSYDVRIAERVLRELYLVPFEACVREGPAALVMAAYNKVNGIPMTENGRLLRGVLKDEWGFDGVVTSDWDAARSTAATALAALDLAMPGPDGPWGSMLAQAVIDGAVTPEVLDDKVIRLLRLARRVGARSGRADPGPAHPALIDPGLLRRATASALTLLRNEGGALPFGALDRLAVIAALAGRAEVTVAEGCQTWVVVPEPELASLRDPGTGEPGLHLEFRAPDGHLLAAEHRASPSLAWWDQLPPGVGWGKPGRIVLTTSFRPGTSGPHLLGVAGVGHLTLTVDGAVVADGATAVPSDPVEAMTRPGEIRATAALEAGRPAQIRLEFTPAAG